MESELNLTFGKRNNSARKLQSAWHLWKSINTLNGSEFGILICYNWTFACNVCGSLGMRTYIQQIVFFVPNLIFMEYGKRCFVVWLFDAVKFKGIYGFAVLFSLLTLFLIQVEQKLNAKWEMRCYEALQTLNILLFSLQRSLHVVKPSWHTKALEAEVPWGLLAQSRAGQGAFSEIPSSQRKRKFAHLMVHLKQSCMIYWYFLMQVSEEEFKDFSFQLLWIMH